MPLVSSVLKLQIEKASEKAANDAMLAMLNMLAGASKDKAATNADVAKEFASKFKAGFAGDVATAIDSYIKTATVVSTSVLVAPPMGGPVVGTITNIVS